MDKNIKLIFISYFSEIHLLTRGSTLPLTGGPGSDSGLSGLENDEKLMKKSGSPEMENSIVDSGRRSQSLEILSDDLRSISISTPSSPSPRPPKIDDKSDARSTNSGHVHFLPNESRNLNNFACSNCFFSSFSQLM